MSTGRDPDHVLHEALTDLGRRADVPRLADDARARALAQLDNAQSSRSGRTIRMLKHPAVASTLGIAASVAIILSVITWFGGGRSVEAAVILEKLNRQIQDVSLIEVELRDIVTEGVTASGVIQISDAGLAGDLRFSVDGATAGAAVDADVSLALTQEQGWILIRELHVDSPDVAPILAFLLPPGTQTLLHLPTEELDDLAEFKTEFRAGLAQLQSQNVRDAMQVIVDSYSDVGGTLRRIDGRTIELTLPLSDAEALSTLIEKVVVSLQAGEVGDGDAREHDREGLSVGLQLDDEGVDLSQADLVLVYDTVAERVLSLQVLGFGANRGAISVRLLDGGIDSNLLDPARVRTPQTRDFDLGALQSTLKQLGQQQGAP